MGSELHGKYQKLAQEYAKLRMQVDVLKKAVRDEHVQKAKTEEELRDKTLNLRKHIQENESLEFRNHQLSKRVSVLQEELESPNKKPSKKRRPLDSASAGAYDVQTQELSAKISENERLHSKLVEITQKSERTTVELEGKVATLQEQVHTHDAAFEKLNREHTKVLGGVRTEKALLEAKVARLSKELEDQRKVFESQSVSSRPVSAKRETLQNGSSNFYDLNVPVIDTKLQADVLKTLSGKLVEFVTTFATQMSTFHSYIEQRCGTYPVDTATGLHMSAVNEKLCKLLHTSSSFTKPLFHRLTEYCEAMEMNPYTLTSFSDLSGFVSAYHEYVVYVETLTSYLQLSLQKECEECVCGTQLTDRNMLLCVALSQFAGSFSVINSYLSILIEESLLELPPQNVVVCYEKLKTSLRDLALTTKTIHDHYSSKVALEYQLPVASQKLNTTNECVLSSLNGLHSCLEKIQRFLFSNKELLKSSLLQLCGTSKNSSATHVMNILRARAVNYIQNLQRGCCDSVPYKLAVYNAKSLSSSSESKDTLMMQVSAGQERMARLEKEKEQLMLDLQLLRVKYEKESKRASTIEEKLANSKPHSSLDGEREASPNPSKGTNLASTATHLSASMGSLSQTAVDSEEDEESQREELIRRHFVTRISELNAQLQEADSRSANFYAECRALQKHLNHSSESRNKLTAELQHSSETITQLQDQLTTTSDSYEKQLSAMSDHLCELNDKILRQADELESSRRTKGKKWGK